MKRITHVEFYDVTQSENPVLLNILIGNGQPAWTNITKDGKPLKPIKNSIKNFNLGMNKDLHGVKMEFKTAITNWNPKAQNKMNYQFGLKGGKKALNIPEDKYTASDPGELFIIDTTVYFI